MKKLFISFTLTFVICFSLLSFISINKNSYGLIPFNRSDLDSIQNLKNNIDSFLIKPFDIVEFHKNISGNSSGFSNDKFYFKPQKGGIYYGFYYPGIETYRIISDSLKLNFNGGWGFTVTAFHPDGKHKHLSQNPNATLIEYCASRNVPSLPQLAFVGQSKQDIKEKLGLPNRDLDSIYIYQNKNNGLFLKLNNGFVSGVKYGKYNFLLDTTKNIPSVILKKIGCRGG